MWKHYAKATRLDILTILQKICHVHRYCFSHFQEAITSIYLLSNDESMFPLVAYHRVNGIIGLCI